MADLATAKDDLVTKKSDLPDIPSCESRPLLRIPKRWDNKMIEQLKHLKMFFDMNLFGIGWKED
jgi:hypothetical protein